MKEVFLPLMLVFMLLSCSEKRPVADPKVLIDADIAFSDFSVSNGYHKAFVEFAADSVVLLKPNQMPLVGRDNLMKSFEGKSDSNLILSWKPVKAIIAESGELGYTYGFWTFISESDTAQGTYLTVWKQDKAGQWKYIADTGNDGLKEPDQK